jgi:DNA-binding MurR/RpiR family transcriptional regulator
MRAVLQRRLDTLSPGRRRLADLVLSDPQGIAFSSVRESAARADVHPSSVVRFATMLGLNGYPALVRLCREHLTEQARLTSRLGRVQLGPAADGLLAATVGYEQQNLVRTLTRIEEVDWDRAVTLLGDAPRVHVMGLRKCLPVAQLMSYLLGLVRPGVHLIAPVTGSLVEELRELQGGDVFVGISVHRYTAATVQAFLEAERRGLRTVAVTDNPASPLARHADLTFLVDCEGVTLLRSVTPFVALVQALATAVALRDGARSSTELQEDEQLLTDFSTYAD